MKYLNWRFILTGMNLNLLVLTTLVLAQNSTITFTEDFQQGWHRNWIERKTNVKPTKYQLVEEDSNFVLMAESDGTASALWHLLNIRPGKRGKISWRWKIDHTLSKNTAEKTKIGDDYAARIYVVFEPHIISWKTRSICYVWAAKAPVGSMYKSPYASSSYIIVIQSGKKNDNKWIDEERNIMMDYERIFGKPPKMITGIAIMVDTDNSRQHALTWFDDIKLEVTESEIDTSKNITRGIKFDY